MTKIQSRIHQYGNEKESKWPPQYGTGEHGVFYWDSDTKEFKEGRPPLKIKRYGQAPFVITDTIEPYYHPGVCKTTSSRKELQEFDRATGTITTDKMIPANPSRFKENKRRRHEDVIASTRKAIADLDNGTAKLTEEQRAACQLRNETIAAAIPDFDPFNAAGRISNEKGRRYKERHRKPRK